MDVWYLDDGTIVCHPAQAANFLAAFDESCEAAGAKRSRPKTKVTLLATGREAHCQRDAWDLESLQRLATVQVMQAQGDPDSCGFECVESLVALGAETLGQTQAMHQFQRATQVVDRMMKKIPLCQDSQVEFVLQRSCLSVAKINHLLRASGVDLLASRGQGGETA